LTHAVVRLLGKAGVCKSTRATIRKCAVNEI
jgi:hypothetical protein